MLKCLPQTFITSPYTIKQPPNTVMSFIKATAKGGEYERDVNATDAALEKGGNRKDLFSIHTLHTSLYL